jgi:hypothetical protein
MGRLCERAGNVPTGSTTHDPVSVSYTLIITGTKLTDRHGGDGDVTGKFTEGWDFTLKGGT